MDGRIVRSGGPELAVELEARGYDWLSETNATEADAAEANETGAAAVAAADTLAKG